MSNQSESKNTPAKDMNHKNYPQTSSKRKAGFFTEVDKEYDTPHSSHPLSSKNYFAEHPPIPMWNIVINNTTLDVVEDRTGQP